MGNKAKINKLNTKWSYVILSILLAFLVKLISQYYIQIKEDALLQVTFDLLTTIFISVSIALFIYNTIDKISKEESAKSIYYGVFKSFLNEEIFSVIKRDFFEQLIVRKDMRISFSISETKTGYKVIREIVF